MSPDHETDQCRYDQGSDYILGAVERPPSKSRNYVRNYSNSRKKYDIDFRMPEEPEHIVPEKRYTLDRREIHSTKGPVDIEKDNCCEKRWECIEHHENRYEKSPWKRRHVPQLEARGYHLEQ